MTLQLSALKLNSSVVQPGERRLVLGLGLGSKMRHDVKLQRAKSLGAQVHAGTSVPPRKGKVARSSSQVQCRRHAKAADNKTQHFKALRRPSPCHARSLTSPFCAIAWASFLAGGLQQVFGKIIRCPSSGASQEETMDSCHEVKLHNHRVRIGCLDSKGSQVWRQED